MTTRFLAVLLTAMLALAGVTLAQDAPTTTTAPAPDVNVQVDAPAPPAAPQINVEAPPSTTTTTNNTSVTRESTVVQDAPAAESWVNPWILIGGGVALVIVLLFIAMAAGSGSDRTVTTVS